MLYGLFFESVARGLFCQMLVLAAIQRTVTEFNIRLAERPET